MQFLSRRSFNFKIARVNHSATSARFSAIYHRFEMQPMKYGNFEQQIGNYAGVHSLFTKNTSSFVSTRPFSLLVSISLVCFYTNNSENVPVNKHEILRKTLLLLLSVCVTLILFPVLGEDEDINECKFFCLY